MNPFRRHTFTPEFIAVWRRYEAANARAAEQYCALPIASRNWLRTETCMTCGGHTYDRERCWACRAEARWGL